MLDTGAALEALLPHRLATYSRRLARHTSLCRLYGVPAWTIEGYFAVPHLRLGAEPLPVSACVSSFENAGHFIDGFIGHTAIVRSGVTLDYLGHSLMVP
jgi:hypothetical protein